MIRSNDDFRDQLLKSEHVTPSLKERHEEEIRAMIEKQLTRPANIAWGLSGLAGMVLAVGFGILAIALPREAPWYARLGFVGGALFGIGWAYLGFKIFRRGFIDLKVDAGIYAGLSWGLPVFLVTMFMVWAPDNITGLRMILSGLVFLVMGAMFLLRNIIEQSELKTREKLLEIEYRLAELTEALKPKEAGPS
jgi:hypothetical protein